MIQYINMIYECVKELVPLPQLSKIKGGGGCLWFSWVVAINLIGIVLLPKIESKLNFKTSVADFVPKCSKTLHQPRLTLLGDSPCPVASTVLSGESRADVSSSVCLWNFGSNRLREGFDILTILARLWSLGWAILCKTQRHRESMSITSNSF